MPGVKLTTQAYCKMVLHGAKYPHCAVNGLLVAEKQKPRKEHLPLGGPGAHHTLFVDCIPLFHGTLALAPMLEVALTLIDSWCKDNSYVIAGYYQANERVKDASPNQVAEKVASRIAEGFSDTALIMTTLSLQWIAWYLRSTCTNTMKTNGGAKTHIMITVKTGQKPSGSRHRSWTAGPTRPLWISITTWMTFGMTGPIQRSIKLFSTCAREGFHGLVSGRFHYPEEENLFLNVNLIPCVES
ncbi:ER membrane protein complex subunit 8 isoform X1 [Choloepus didactylus]|uniref:ER membrane protein complex subunit 8 isoform X1 n=1 Tax=Choloepus didactylus TaxID=27675 RepID=UPI00189E4238|nr:ER membrane protein complex subunit 8 isoform X1 [Choloepus didactylus]